MTATLSIIRGQKRFMARVTADGQVIGQALSDDLETCQRRAVRQAYRWAGDRGWKQFTIVKEQDAK